MKHKDESHKYSTKKERKTSIKKMIIIDVKKTINYN